MVSVPRGEAGGGIAEPSGGRYDFAVVPGSPYARAITLLDGYAGPGLVVDLGCSFGRVAEVIAERGRSYVGIDIDDEALASLQARSHQTGRLDLTVGAEVAQLHAIVGDRPVGAVFALDVLEHLPDTVTFLDQLIELLRRWGDPLLVTSLPNVAHRDLAAKLLAGRWDYTDVGLHDRTHVSLFTERRMLDELGGRGLDCVAVDDIVQPAPDQHFPPLHPYLTDGTPAACLVSWLRSVGDTRGDTYQFVRAWRQSPPSDPVTVTPVAKLTVIVAFKDGHRNLDGLEETLVCLASQDTDDFDVVIPVAGDRLEAVEILVGTFATEFADRVATQRASAPSAAARLNVALSQVRASFTGFVIAGDVVTSTWVRQFVEAAEARPGAVVRSRSFQRVVVRTGGATLSQTNAVAVSDDTFDLWRHLSVDQLPLGSFALPTALSQAGLRFDENVRAATWKFGFIVAMLAGVADIPAITCVHQRLAGDTDPNADDLAVALEGTPVFVPPGWVGRLQGDRNHLVYLTAELAAAQHHAHTSSLLYEQVSASRWWRATSLARRGVTVLRTKRRAGS